MPTDWIKRIAEDERKRDDASLRGTEAAARKADVVHVHGQRLLDDLRLTVARDIGAFRHEFPSDQVREIVFDPVQVGGGFAVHKPRYPTASLNVAPNLDAAMKDVFTAQQELLQKKTDAAIARIGKLGAGPDYAAAEVQLEKIGKQWKGLPPADAAQKELARFGSDPAIKKELAAGRALQKLKAGFDASKGSQRSKLIDALQQFRKKYDGTYAASQAEKDITQLAGQK